MPRPSANAAELRQLLSLRFPERARRPSGVVPTGTAPLDQALGGGLARGRLTELVSAAPSSGGQLVLVQLLLATRAARERAALIDGADGFDPRAAPPDALRHLVWARCAAADQALAAADVLIRDGNYAAAVLDLRGLEARQLRRLPAAAWYRLQRAAEGGSAAVLIQTEFPLVPAVPWRLVLREPLPLGRARQARGALAGSLRVEVDRSASAAPAGADPERALPMAG